MQKNQKAYPAPDGSNKKEIYLAIEELWQESELLNSPADTDPSQKSPLSSSPRLNPGKVIHRSTER